MNRQPSGRAAEVPKGTAKQLPIPDKERTYPASTVMELRAEVDKLRNDTEMGKEVNKWKNMYFQADKGKWELSKEVKALREQIRKRSSTADTPTQLDVQPKRAASSRSKKRHNARQSSKNAATQTEGDQFLSTSQPTFFTVHEKGDLHEDNSHFRAACIGPKRSISELAAEAFIEQGRGNDLHPCESATYKRLRRSYVNGVDINS